MVAVLCPHGSPPPNRPLRKRPSPRESWATCYPSKTPSGNGHVILNEEWRPRFTYICNWWTWEQRTSNLLLSHKIKQSLHYNREHYSWTYLYIFHTYIYKRAMWHDFLQKTEGTIFPCLYCYLNYIRWKKYSFVTISSVLFFNTCCLKMAATCGLYHNLSKSKPPISLRSAISVEILIG